MHLRNFPLLTLKTLEASASLVPQLQEINKNRPHQKNIIKNALNSTFVTRLV